VKAVLLGLAGVSTAPGPQFMKESERALDCGFDVLDEAIRRTYAASDRLLSSRQIYGHKRSVRPGHRQKRPGSRNMASTAFK
jgi:hypothetical protein